MSTEKCSYFSTCSSLTVELERQDVVGVARDRGQWYHEILAEERLVVPLPVDVVLRDRLDEHLAVLTGESRPTPTPTTRPAVRSPAPPAW